MTLYTTYPSPVGELLLRADDDGVLTALWMGHHGPSPDWRRDDDAFDRAREQLDAYFAGDRAHFDLPLRLHGTDWQRRVWEALRDIPYGETISYGELALRVGAPGSARAVGAANGRNPISIIVPCHRVIGADGTLTGYGGGIGNKRRLLEHERGVAALVP